MDQTVGKINLSAPDGTPGFINDFSGKFCLRRYYTAKTNEKYE
jgi:hypothetical protein